MYPNAYIQYLVHFHSDRDYFECHEVLEEYWKEDNKQHNNYWVGLIQLAVSLYHQRRNNYSGAEKLMEKALLTINNHQAEIGKLGLHFESLIIMMKTRLKDMQISKPYFSINLPIVDKALLKTCKDACKQLNLNWGENSNLLDDYLIHKHTLRDRSSVLAEQKMSKRNRLPKRA